MDRGRVRKGKFKRNKNPRQSFGLAFVNAVDIVEMEACMGSK